jgi:hypothetical protein
MLKPKGFSEGVVNAEIMDGERNSIGAIMLAKESAVSPSIITCENGAGKTEWLQGGDSDRDAGRGGENGYRGWKWLSAVTLTGRYSEGWEMINRKQDEFKIQTRPNKSSVNTLRHNLGVW